MCKHNGKDEKVREATVFVEKGFHKILISTDECSYWIEPKILSITKKYKD